MTLTRRTQKRKRKDTIAQEAAGGEKMQNINTLHTKDTWTEPTVCDGRSTRPNTPEREAQGS